MNLCRPRELQERALVKIKNRNTDLPSENTSNTSAFAQSHFEEIQYPDDSLGVYMCIASTLQIPTHIGDTD